MKRFFALFVFVLCASTHTFAGDVSVDSGSSKQTEGSAQFSMAGYFVGARANFNNRSFDKGFVDCLKWTNNLDLTKHNTDFGLGLEWGCHWMMQACFIGLYFDWNARLAQAKHYPSSFDLGFGLRLGYLTGRFAPYLRMGGRCLAIKSEPADTERQYGFSWDFGGGLDVLTESGFFYGLDMGYLAGSGAFEGLGGATLSPTLSAVGSSKTGFPRTNNLFSEISVHLRVGYHF